MRVIQQRPRPLPAILARLGIGAFLALSLASNTSAQTPTEFYRGKTVEVYVGFTAGGGYDLYARLLARHMRKFLPGNPNIVVKNMEGAGSVRLANWLTQVAPKDGTVFGTFGHGTAFEPLFGQKGAQFRGTDFTWIGSANDEHSVCASMAISGIRTFDDAKARELTLGAVSMSDDTGQFAKVLSSLFGAKFKIVTGYPGGNDLVLAMERGEVQGRCGWAWSTVKAARQDWLDNKKINILIQTSLTKHPDLPNVPLIIDLATNDEQRQIIKLVFARLTMGRPFLAPPGVPSDRVIALRTAFMDTMRDREFLAEAEKMNLEIDPVDGENIDVLVHEIYATPANIVEKAATILN